LVCIGSVVCEIMKMWIGVRSSIAYSIIQQASKQASKQANKQRNKTIKHSV